MSASDDHVGNLVWEAVEAARLRGWLLSEFLNESRDAWKCLGAREESVRVMETVVQEAIAEL